MHKTLTLSQIWSKTNGLYVESPIIYLRVQTLEQPVSYVPNQVWLASYEKLKGESGWSVGVWGNFLRKVPQDDLPAVNSIFKNIDEIDLETMEAGQWIQVPVPPRNLTEAHI